MGLAERRTSSRDRDARREVAGRVLHPGLRHGAGRAVLDARRREHGARLPAARRSLVARARAGARDAVHRAGARRLPPGIHRGQRRRRRHAARRLQRRLGGRSPRHARPPAHPRALRHGPDRSRHVPLDLRHRARGRDDRVLHQRRAHRRRRVDRSGGRRTTAASTPPTWHATAGRRPSSSKGGAVPQPDPHAKPNFVFPEEWKERGEALVPHDATRRSPRRSACRRRRCRRSAS